MGTTRAGATGVHHIAYLYRVIIFFSSDAGDDQSTQTIVGEHTIASYFCFLQNRASYASEEMLLQVRNMQASKADQKIVRNRYMRNSRWSHLMFSHNYFIFPLQNNGIQAISTHARATKGGRIFQWWWDEATCTITIPSICWEIHHWAGGTTHGAC